MMRPTRDGIEDVVKAKQEGRYDMYVKPKDIQADLFGFEELKYCVTREGELSDRHVAFMDSAMTQLLNKIKIPTSFYNRCPDWLKALNFNTHNMKHKNKYMFRMEPGRLNICRAALSDSYGIIDDVDLFPILFESLDKRSDITYRKFYYDDYITQLMVDFTDAKGTHNGQEYVAGLLVTNSETSHSAVWIEPVVHIPTCSFVSRNVLKRQGLDCRIIHRGKFPKERVAPLVEKAKEVAQVGIIQLAEAFTSHVPIDTVLTFAKNTDALPNRFVAILEEEWHKEQRIIRGEAARRIIMLAEDLPLFQRIQVEQSVGSFIGLFDSYKTRFADIAKEVNR
jgi:hypothetical protein